MRNEQWLCRRSGWAATAIAIVLAGCGNDSDPPPTGESKAAIVGDETPGSTCNDNIDNGGDGPKDCADSDCETDPVCLPQNVGITKFIEIDVLTGTPLANDDANLDAGNDADNPNLPGPNPATPLVPGAEADYTDWRQLPSDFPGFFEDATGAQETAFENGSCVGFGSAPKKADITDIGIAISPEYLNVLLIREDVTGAEQYHLFFTTTPPFTQAAGNCESQLFYQLDSNAVQVRITFPSTASLATGTIEALKWNGANGAILSAEATVASNQWAAAPANTALVAFNIAPSNKDQSQDTEVDLAGNPLLTGQAAEGAVALSVFGAGCGLARSFSAITTSSPASNDALQDLFGPRTIVSGQITAALELTPRCDEAYDYEIQLFDQNQDPITDISNLNISFESTNCADQSPITTLTGTIAEPVTAQTTCDVKVVVAGKTGTGFEGCSVDATASVDVFPDVTAAPSLTGTCTAEWAFNANADGGGTLGFSWSFSPVADVNPDTSTAESGTGTLTNTATKTAVDIDASLTITDTRPGVASCPAIVPCSGGVVQSGFSGSCSTTAYHPITLAVAPASGDLACSESLTAQQAAALLAGSVPVNATITGGSGVFTTNWTAQTAAGEPTPSLTSCGTNNDLSCTFTLANEACTAGGVQLSVIDIGEITGVVCPSPGAQSVSATKTTTLDVTPNP